MLFLATAPAVPFLYSILLPFQYTQRFSIANWRYLDLQLAGFSLAFALLIAWLVIANVYAFRRLARTSGSPLSVGAAIGSLLPSLQCCTPVVPTLLALVGVSSIGIYGLSGRIQSFFAREEIHFLLVLLGLLAASAIWSWRLIRSAACLADGEGCEQ